MESRDEVAGEKTKNGEVEELGSRDMESLPDSGGAENLAPMEEDQSYAKSSLGVSSNASPEMHKVLGVEWDVAQDKFQFNVGKVTRAMEESEPSKQNLVSVTARFFDPLGVVSPVTILFKMFCQQLCEAKVGWDEPLTGRLREKWDNLLLMLRSARAIMIPRCLYHKVSHPRQSVKLIGFCDASAKAYASVVYARIGSGDADGHIKFVAAITMVAPVGGATIPRMELLSALLLSKLISSILTALEHEVLLNDPLCFTDSKATLYWIQGTNHEWKQFVENRVTTLRGLVRPECWRHCPGRENPADIPSRGMAAAALARNPLWLEGPTWLHSKEAPPAPMPDHCRSEMKKKDAVPSLITLEDNTSRPGPLFEQLFQASVQDYSAGDEVCPPSAQSSA